MRRIPKFHRAVLSAFLNLLGSLLLFYSLQFSSSEFLLETLDNGHQALCVNGNAMFEWRAGGVALGRADACKNATGAKPTALINTDHPAFVGWGLGMLFLGFLLQIFSIEKPVDLQAIAVKVKALEKEERDRQRINPHTGLPSRH